VFPNRSVARKPAIVTKRPVHGVTRGPSADRRFQRLRLAARSDFLTGATSVSALAASHGVSRSTIHRWMLKDAQAGHPWESTKLPIDDLAGISETATLVIRDIDERQKFLNKLEALPKVADAGNPGASVTLLLEKAALLVEMMLHHVARSFALARNPGISHARLVGRVVRAACGVVTLQRQVYGLREGEPSDPRLIRVRLDGEAVTPGRLTKRDRSACFEVKPWKVTRTIIRPDGSSTTRS
jgi:transposase-like protein